MSRDEGHLVRAMVEYQAGEIRGFEVLYGAFAADLSRHFGSLVRGGDAAADLVQETFMEIHRSRHTYLPPLPVRPWVFGVARNVLRRHRRTAWRRGRYEEFPGEVDEPAVGAAQVPGRLEPGDVREAVGRLAPARRRAFELHHVHGFSFLEVARILHVSVDGAKLRSSRAMSTLREWLGVSRGAKGE